VKVDRYWEDTAVELPAARWVNALTGDSFEGGELRLVDFLQRFPVALLCRQGEN
jgi:maltooligosyltrehalose synthase